MTLFRIATQVQCVKLLSSNPFHLRMRRKISNLFIRPQYILKYYIYIQILYLIAFIFKSCKAYILYYIEGGNIHTQPQMLTRIFFLLNGCRMMKLWRMQEKACVHFQSLSSLFLPACQELPALLHLPIILLSSLPQNKNMAASFQFI